MDLSALIVTVVGTLLFFGFAVFLSIYSRRGAQKKLPSTAESSEGE